jgi:hypothetical protein
LGVTQLYRLWGQEGELLYVGISNNIRRRHREHSKNKPWWGQVQSKTICEFITRDDALKAEYHAINTECPKYNIACYPPVTPNRLEEIERERELRARWRKENERRHREFYWQHEATLSYLRGVEDRRVFGEFMHQLGLSGNISGNVYIPLDKSPWIVYPVD